MTESTRNPRGIQRDPSSSATPPRPDPTRNELTPVPATGQPLRRIGDVANELVSEWGATRIDRLATRIAVHQAEQLDELALTGNPVTPDVVETSLRLAARRVLEEAMDA